MMMQERDVSAFSRRRAIQAGTAIGIGMAAVTSRVRGEAAMAQDQATPASGAVSTTMVATLTLQAAMSVLQAALDKATEFGVPQNVVVVDAAGNVKAAARQDGNGLASLTFAPAKAYSAVALGGPTDQVAMALSGNPAVMSSILQDPRILLLGGGAPLMVGGSLVGGIGVSGGSEEQDQECANAGAAVLAM